MTIKPPGGNKTVIHTEPGLFQDRKKALENRKSQLERQPKLSNQEQAELLAINKELQQIANNQVDYKNLAQKEKDPSSIFNSIQGFFDS